MDFFTIMGLTGVASYVIAYSLLQFERLDGNSLTYSALNVAAAALVLISLTSDFNLASAITQVLWIGIGVAGIVTRLCSRRVVTAAVVASKTGPPELVAAAAVEPRRIGLRPDLPPSRGRRTTGLRADLPPSRSSGAVPGTAPLGTAPLISERWGGRFG